MKSGYFSSYILVIECRIAWWIWFNIEGSKVDFQSVAQKQRDGKLMGVFKFDLVDFVVRDCSEKFV